MLSDYTIRINGGVWRGCTAPTSDINNRYIIITSNLRDYASFRDEEWWEIEHVLNATQRTHMIFDEKHQKYD